MSVEINNCMNQPQHLISVKDKYCMTDLHSSGVNIMKYKRLGVGGGGEGFTFYLKCPTNTTAIKEII